MMLFAALDSKQIAAGVDEVGRGPLVGNVVAAAVVLDPNKSHCEGLADSKKLTEKRRNALNVEILEKVPYHGVLPLRHLLKLMN